MLYETVDAFREERRAEKGEIIPRYIPGGLNKNFELRPYQNFAFENFITYFESRTRPKHLQVLFHMATGSGKTLIMAGLILYLYKKGYRNFLFFVNLSNILEKTKDNFLNVTSSKYLFAEEVVIDGERVRINQVDNFQSTDPDAINIYFTTTQKLHSDMDPDLIRENGISIDDFREKKIVLISDEAHHLNIDTKRKDKLTEAEKLSKASWEKTVNTIFDADDDNILLEFTATCDLSNEKILEAYKNKIIYDYRLKKFYDDKYSKEILTLIANVKPLDRALMAIILSQYRLKMFEDYRFAIKPVILFKSVKVAESKEFMAAFIDMVKNLNGSQISRIAGTVNNEIMDKAFKYFSKKGISPDMLAAELREDFSEEHCISVNEEEEAKQWQIRLNNLEDADNPYRAIFEVKKLDEGWDVLNLFDIVRVSEKRQSGGKGLSSTTISEAQLIGRGARYFPFQINDEQPKYQRKYDDDVTNELRVCETLYYHCYNNEKYIADLHKALNEIGLGKDGIVQQTYKLKEKFKKDTIYTRGLIFLNERVLISRNDVYELSPNIRSDFYEYKAPTGTSTVGGIMDEVAATDDTRDELKTTQKTIKEIAAINYAIVNKALMKYPIYKFDNLKENFPHLTSTREFITKDEYLGAVKVTILSKDENPSVEILYGAVFNALGKIADRISRIEETYRGSEEFKKESVYKIFRDKTVNYTKTPENGGIGISQNDASVRLDRRINLANEDWFAYTDNYGTSEEKAFVAYFKGQVDELKKIYSKIYLVRNERLFGIYSFNNGIRFEPDYVLFLQRKKGKSLEQIQVFIEPKGSHLLDKDSWKEEFLLQLKEKVEPVEVLVDNMEYRIWGFHFFNEEKRVEEFGKDFHSLLNPD